MSERKTRKGLATELERQARQRVGSPAPEQGKGPRKKPASRAELDRAIERIDEQIDDMGECLREVRRWIEADPDASLLSLAEIAKRIGKLSKAIERYKAL